ncbi:MAG: hypothetical protein ACUVTD_08170 [Nitrososphaerales archaeon]
MEEVKKAKEKEKIERWPGRGPFSHLPPWQRPGWRAYPPCAYSSAPSASPAKYYFLVKKKTEEIL